MLEFINSLKKSEKIRVIINTLLWTLWSLLGISIMLIALKIIELMVVNNAQVKDIYKYWVWMGAVVIIKGICFTFANTQSHFLGHNLLGRLRKDMIDHIKKFSLGYFNKERIGNISTVVHNDIDTVQVLLTDVICRMLSDIIVTIILGAGLFLLNWKMGVALIIALPFALATLWLGKRKEEKLQEINSADMSAMISNFVEYTKGIPTIKTFGDNPSFFKKVLVSIERFACSSKKTSLNTAYNIGKYTLFIVLGYGILIVYGTHLTFIKGISLVTFGKYMMLGREFYRPFFNGESYWINFIKFRDSYQRIKNVMEHPCIESPNITKCNGNYSVKFENVYFEYEKNAFKLKNINFEIADGTTTALVSPSGSGKSTIANLLVRFWDVKKGNIKIGGADIRNLEYDELLSKLSIVLQDVMLFDDSIYENIKVGKRNATKEEVVEAAQKAMIHDFIMSLPKGYETQIGENGARLSGGQKQRISIARAIIKDSPIIILDEATSAVDPINEAQIQKAINNLVKGKTLLVIAHHLKTIRNVDQIIVLKEGEIKQKGTHDELVLQDGIYKTLWYQNAEIS
ncbi:MAG: ABC transporter ATP-binding protein [Bacillota bacterium]|nr:ABC transporter ATP-binding protein [Bacillota bacterium]